MRSRAVIWSVVLTAGMSVGALGGAASVPTLGPPAICTPIQCDGQGMPWDNADSSPPKHYSSKQAVADAIKILDGSTDPLMHMETIRRATICLTQDKARAQELLARLLARTAEVEADDAPAAARELAWLDAGYFAGAAWQIGLDMGWRPGERNGVPGLAWLDRAIEVSGGDSAAHYAAAIVGHPAMNESKRGEYDRHLLAAFEGSKPGTRLRANVEDHMRNWGETAETLRSRL
ncbi:MAG: hypothetical protein IPJ41_17465 [Phycisphaerales bacterium]|nr:hypothetical protein [Phycisphaerales bacterium]